jgi:hypothetical protein
MGRIGCLAPFASEAFGPRERRASRAARDSRDFPFIALQPRTRGSQRKRVRPPKRVPDGRQARRTNTNGRQPRRTVVSRYGL